MNALRFAVVGSPVAHSKSPAMHAAAYRALGMPHVYEKLETSETELGGRVAALRDGTYAGLNVTVPHKKCVLAFVDDRDETVLATGAANTLVRLPDGRIRAHNTDALALVEEIARLAGDRARLRGKSGVVLGSGGAARAAVWALEHLGMAPVTVRARATESLVAPPAEAPDLGAIAQATSCGMQGAASGDVVADAVAWSSVPHDAVALDVVYAPPETPFLARAAARGLARANGLGMLARQGAAAFELWLGVAPPLDVMLAALG